MLHYPWKSIQQWANVDQPIEFLKVYFALAIVSYISKMLASDLLLSKRKLFFWRAEAYCGNEKRGIISAYAYREFLIAEVRIKLSRYAPIITSIVRPRGHIRILQESWPTCTIFVSIVESSKRHQFLHCCADAISICNENFVCLQSPRRSCPCPSHRRFFSQAWSCGARCSATWQKKI